MTAQFNFGNRTFTRNRETVLTLNEEAKKNVAASFASAGFNEHFVETQLPQVNLRINKDKKEKYHHKYNEQFFYETCHFMDILMPQIQEFFSSDFLSRPPQTIKHTQSLFEQHYLLHLALSKIEENNNYLSLVTHICRSNAFDPGVRCKAMFALFQSKHPFSTECLSLTAQYFSDKNTLKCQKELLISKVFFALKNNVIDEESVKLFQSKLIAKAHPDTLIAVITFLSKCKTYAFNNPGLDNIISNVRENLSKKNKEKLPDTEFQVNYYPPQDIPKDEPYYPSLLRTALVSKSVQNFIEYALKEESEEEVVQNLEQSAGPREWFIENKTTAAQQDSYIAPRL
ncbi:hypothetical protein Lqui_0367 [Legionella quinlivanii]|uniref:Uncharacterized protein n=1 Tax=Legionella quinlivanii TaxID=45073 RepID=A0A0W0Y4T3_9GAMM|nr:hypothetical protein [Legionella quinlivanii]KTD51523.1 hypothetical protein Lqui_0367 [Legionella quinlivanii]SEF57813.1 hypothetical protein SAMN02746093_00505 [Legionella quinlivanii DSM 21216]STY10950.1 Uncharacterised protein [Legionella quinlivanii]